MPDTQSYLNSASVTLGRQATEPSQNESISYIPPNCRSQDYVYGLENDSSEQNNSNSTSDKHDSQKLTSVTKRIHTTHALHPLTHDEATTYHSMIERDDNAEVFVMPNHRIDEAGNLRGFRLVVDRNSDCVQLPITREMFMGSTCVECDPGDRDIHPDVIRLLNNPAEVKNVYWDCSRRLPPINYQTW